MGYVYRRGGKLWIGYTLQVEGKPKPQQQSTGLEDSAENRKKAREIVAAIEARLKARDALGIETQGPITVVGYLPAWTKRRVERGQKNAKNDDVRLRKYAMTAIGELALIDVRQRHIRSLFHALLPRWKKGEISSKLNQNGSSPGSAGVAVAV